MAKLVKIPGIIISASAIRAKATSITIQCRSCRNTISNIPLKPGLEGYTMPRKCPRYNLSLWSYAEGKIFLLVKWGRGIFTCIFRGLKFCDLWNLELKRVGVWEYAILFNF